MRKIYNLRFRLSIITGNLCLCLLITNMLVIFGLDRTENKVTCAVIAGLLHFWVLSAFFWMLVEGYHLYKMVILVFQRGADFSTKCYYAFAYGCPIVVVAVSASIRSDGYGGGNYCWLSSHDGLMWSFIGPACAIILVNIVIFILTLRSASSVRIKKEQNTITKIKSWARGSLSVMCLLGLTWCLGLFYISKKLNVFSYIFTLLNGLQGVFIFLFHILLNEKVKAIFFSRWKGKKRTDLKKYPTQTSSNRLTSKSSTRTSLHSNGYANNSATTRAPKTISSEVSPPSYGSKREEARRSFIDLPVKNTNGRTDIPDRKHTAGYTKSHNFSCRFPTSEPNKMRSQSFLEDDGFHCQTGGGGPNTYFNHS